MTRSPLPIYRDLAAVQASLLQLSDTAETPAVARVLLQAYELTLVAEQSLDPMQAPVAPSWYDTSDSIAVEVVK